MNSSYVKLWSAGKFTKLVLATAFKFASTRFSKMSFIFWMSNSTFARPSWTLFRYPSMFMEVQVSEYIPGCSLFSRSRKCGPSILSVTGAAVANTRSYSLKAYESWL